MTTSIDPTGQDGGDAPWPDESEPTPWSTSTPAAAPTLAPTSSPTSAPTPAPNATPSPAPMSYSFTGTTQDATDRFALEAGLSVFRFEHAGEGHFAVWLLDSQGERVDLLANDAGPIEGAKSEHIETAGNHVLDVKADGPWSVRVEQPRPASAPAPGSYAGLYYLNVSANGAWSVAVE